MNKLDKESVTGISALLVHAANIDEIYSDDEKILIKKFIKSYNSSSSIVTPLASTFLINCFESTPAIQCLSIRKAFKPNVKYLFLKLS